MRVVAVCFVGLVAFFTVAGASPENRPSAQCDRSWAVATRLNDRIGITDIAAFDSGHVWVVGQRSRDQPPRYVIGAPVIAHWDGQQWTQRRLAWLGSVDIIAGTSERRLWAFGARAGRGAFVESFDGRRWRSQPFPRIEDPFFPGASAGGPSDVWAVVWDDQRVSRSFLVRWDGRRWRVLARHTDDRLYSVAAIRTGEAWVVGHGIWRWRGGRLRFMGRPRGLVAAPAVHVVSGRDAWAVGGGFPQVMVLHWDGNAWRPVAPPPVLPYSELQDVTVASSRVWVVGSEPPPNSLIFSQEDGRWTKHTLPAEAQHVRLSAISSTPTGDVWAAGGNVVLHYRCN